MAMPSDAQLDALVGHRFPGGERTIEAWESYLLTDCTGRDQLAGDLVHPIALFHVPIQGVGTTIAELFDLGGTSGRAGEVSLLGYDWEYERPLRSSVTYRLEGGIASAERRRRDDGSVTGDVVAFVIELFEPDGALAARVTNTWRFNR
jgi:hypothetical protein